MIIELGQLCSDLFANVDRVIFDVKENGLVGYEKPTEQDSFIKRIVLM